MDKTQELAHAIKEAKADFERECAHLPRPEVDRLWQRQLSELLSLTTSSRVRHKRSYRSAPTRVKPFPDLGHGHKLKFLEAVSSLPPASEVAAVTPIESSTSLGWLQRFPEETVLFPQTASTPPQAGQRLPEDGLVEGSRKRKRSVDTVSTYDMLPPPYALSDVGRPPQAPRIVIYALNVGDLEVRRSSDCTTQYRVLTSGKPRDDVPQSHQKAVNDFQAAIIAGHDLLSQEFPDPFKAPHTASTDALQRKIRTFCSLCMSVGALLYNWDFHNESQTSHASRCAAEACRVLSSLKSLAQVHAQLDENKDSFGATQSSSQEPGVDAVLSELDTVIADLAFSSFDLQMMRII